MENKIINCPICGDWDVHLRMRHTCGYCNNSGKMSETDTQQFTCNMCASSLMVDKTTPIGLIGTKVQGQYSSVHLFDGVKYRFSLCELCLRNLFNSFKMEPNIVDQYSDWTWKKDQERYEYLQWKEAGHFRAAYLNRTCNQVKNCPNPAAYSVEADYLITDECACEEHKSSIGLAFGDKLVEFVPEELKPFQ